MSSPINLQYISEYHIVIRTVQSVKPSKRYYYKAKMLYSLIPSSLTFQRGAVLRRQNLTSDAEVYSIDGTRTERIKIFIMALDP